MSVEAPQELVSAATHDAVMAASEQLSTLTTTRDARDEVNQPTINNWLEAMGFDNPRFQAGEAPPTMAQVWTMYGLGGKASDDDPLHLMMNVLTDLGFTGVLGTNSEQTYERYLRVGERVRIELALESVVGPKSTAMGVGYFVTSMSTWFVGDEPVATMLFRVFKFIPKAKADTA
jgi:hypothetical protein